MHPILKSRARLGAYLLGWAPVAALFAAQAAVKDAQPKEGLINTR